MALGPSVLGLTAPAALVPAAGALVSRGARTRLAGALGILVAVAGLALLVTLVIAWTWPGALRGGTRARTPARMPVASAGAATLPLQPLDCDCSTFAPTQAPSFELSLVARAGGAATPLLTNEDLGTVSAMRDVSGRVALGVGVSEEIRERVERATSARVGDTMVVRIGGQVAQRSEIIDSIGAGFLLAGLDISRPEACALACEAMTRLKARTAPPRPIP